MKKPHRCPRCGKRCTLRLWHNEYTLPPKCPNCPSKKLHMLKSDYKYAKKRNTEQRCHCDAHHFPHRYRRGFCNPTMTRKAFLLEYAQTTRNGYYVP